MAHPDELSYISHVPMVVSKTFEPINIQDCSLPFFNTPLQYEVDYDFSNELMAMKMSRDRDEEIFKEAERVRRKLDEQKLLAATTEAQKKLERTATASESVPRTKSPTISHSTSTPSLPQALETFATNRKSLDHNSFELSQREVMTRTGDRHHLPPLPSASSLPINEQNTSVITDPFRLPPSPRFYKNQEPHQPRHPIPLAMSNVPNVMAPPPASAAIANGYGTNSAYGGYKYYDPSARNHFQPVHHSYPSSPLTSSASLTVLAPTAATASGTTFPTSDGLMKSMIAQTSGTVGKQASISATKTVSTINPSEFEMEGSSPFDDAMLRAIDDRQELNHIFNNHHFRKK